MTGSSTRNAALRRPTPGPKRAHRDASLVTRRASGIRLVVLFFAALLAGAASPVTSRPPPLDDMPPAAVHANAAGARGLPSGWSRTRTQFLEIQYDPKHPGGLTRLEKSGDALLEDTADRLGIQPSRCYVVRLARGRTTFERVQPGRPPPWAAGTAYPELGMMVLLTGEGVLWRLPAQFEKVFVHECVHLLLGSAAGGKPIPRWFDEGMARLMAGEFSMEEWTLLSRGALLGKLIWFSQLDRGFPIAEGRANLAYAQSRSFLSYLAGRFGPEVLPALVREVARGRSLNDTLWRVVGRGLNSLEEDWRADLTRDMKWLSAVFGGTTLWGLMGLLVVLAYLKRRARSRRRRAQWAEEEGEWRDVTSAALIADQGFLWIAGSSRWPSEETGATPSRASTGKGRPGAASPSPPSRPPGTRR